MERVGDCLVLGINRDVPDRFLIGLGYFFAQTFIHPMEGLHGQQGTGLRKTGRSCHYQLGYLSSRNQEMSEGREVMAFRGVVFQLTKVFVV